MQNLKTRVKASLKNAQRIVVLGVGSELRGDDVAGVVVIETLEISMKKDPAKSKKVKMIAGTTAPENYTGEIKKFDPTHIIMIDAANIGKDPGSVDIIDPEAIRGASFSTHMLPTYMLFDYLKMFLKSEIIIIGIQPGNLEFGTKPTEKVLNAARDIAAVLFETL